jgi:hypothetical protein
MKWTVVLLKIVDDIKAPDKAFGKIPLWACSKGEIKKMLINQMIFKILSCRPTTTQSNDRQQPIKEVY